MDSKKFNRYILITSIFLFLVSIVGLILLGLPYLNVDTKYLGQLINTKSYSGYMLISDQSIINASFEPLLHLIGFVFFLVGSLIFIILVINNKFGKKKIDFKIKTNLNNKQLTIIQVICSIILVVIAVLIIIYGFLLVSSESSNYVYHLGISKTINAILLGINCLILTLSINLLLNLSKK